MVKAHTSQFKDYLYTVRQRMALRPTTEECAAIVDVASLAQWCGLSSVAPVNTNNATPAPTSEVQNLFAHIVCGPQDHYRSLASVTEADWKEYTKDLKVNS